MADQTESVQVGKVTRKIIRRAEKTYLNLENQHCRKGKRKTHQRACQPIIRIPPSRFSVKS